MSSPPRRPPVQKERARQGQREHRLGILASALTLGPSRRGMWFEVCLDSDVKHKQAQDLHQNTDT